MKNTLILFTALMSLTALAACNTFQGLGQDMESAGQGLSSVATKTKEKISGQ